MSQPPAMSDPESRRLLWRCRRGMKELDVLLERYARATLPAASAAERRALAELLAQPDPLLAAWLLGGITPAEARFAPLTARILDLCRSQAGSALF
jgi:antitoxin CptB